MSNSSPNSLPTAMEWVSRITTVSFELVIPGVLGNWLDAYFNTHFLALLGFALGMVVGFWHLMLMTKMPPQKK
jgi:ATP synthase protein I